MNTYLVTNADNTMHDALKKNSIKAFFSADGTRAVIVADKEPKGGAWTIEKTLPDDLATYVQKEHLASSVLDALNRQASARNATSTDRTKSIKTWLTLTAELENLEKMAATLKEKRSASVKEIALTHGKEHFVINGIESFVSVRRGGVLVVQAVRGASDGTASQPPKAEKASQPPKAEKAKNGRATVNA